LFSHRFLNKSIGLKIPEASEEAIDIIDKMLELNPKNRPSIDKILEHPYFTQSPKSSLIINPFTSPLGTPERNDTFSTHAFFSEPVFGADSAPSFGNIVNDDSPKRMDILNAGMFGCKTDYYRKSKSLLNDGDWMYMDSRYEESPLNKLVSKSSNYIYFMKILSVYSSFRITSTISFIFKSQLLIKFKIGDTKESCFGGFNVNEIETIRESNNKRKVILCDDEITNSETAYNQDFFNDKVKSNQEELPWFGGLTPEGSQSISNYK